MRRSSPVRSCKTPGSRSRLAAPAAALALVLATAAAAQQFRANDRSNTAEATARGAEVAYVLDLFRQLNPRSIAENVEYCGFIGLRPNGELVRTRHYRGNEDTCYLPPWPDKWVVIASYHTHSTYSPDYDSERPSVQDMDSDRQNGIDGYIATPGGRLWFIDSDTMVARQICGSGCLPADPDFVPDPPGTIKQAYTYGGLVGIEN